MGSLADKPQIELTGNVLSTSDCAQSRLRRPSNHVDCSGSNCRNVSLPFCFWQFALIGLHSYNLSVPTSYVR